MTLLAQYAKAILRKEITDNPKQREVLEAFQVLLKKKSWYSQKRQGIYLYGSVGVGKTYLMDLFYQALGGKKARYHFHQFMQAVDAQLRNLQGQKNPLRQIAKDWAFKAPVLCLDEFLVHDVAHAMILAEFLQALIQYGTTLIFTANTAPDDLYLHGIGRARFLPAIALIKQHCKIVQLQEIQDYRLQGSGNLETYLYPLTAETQDKMEEQFEQFEAVEDSGVIPIQNREIPYLKRASKAIWFDFNVLCNLGRSQLDYLELARRFDTIFLSGIPGALEEHPAKTLLFIYLIDILYDCGVQLIMSADVPVQDLYKEGNLAEAFQRTKSRLIEMQSKTIGAIHQKPAKN